MNKKTSFGQRIKELRKAKNLSQRELAERVEKRLIDNGKRGFDFTYLSKIENEKMPPPSQQAIIHLADELEADCDELLALAEKAPQDLGETLKKSESARKFYRSAVDMNLSEEQWEDLLKKLREEKQE